MAGYIPEISGFDTPKSFRVTHLYGLTETYGPATVCAWQSDWDKLDVDGVRVIATRQHGRKLRRGTLRGNEFRIVVRDIEGDRKVLNRTLEKIVDEGVPNYFGPQRFGHNAANISLAQAVLGKENRRVNRQKRQFALSAARSLIFNAVLSARVTAGTWSEILEGDLAGRVGSRSFFPVKELTDEIRVWAQKKDIHPTGPLWGTGVRDRVNHYFRFPPNLRQVLLR